MRLSSYLPPRDLWPDLKIPELPIKDAEKINMAEELLDRHIYEGRGDYPAVYFEDRRITYKEIYTQVKNAGHTLMQKGICPGDRVGIRMTNIPQAIIANFAILRIGAIPVPLSPLWSKSEIVHTTKDALVAGVFVNNSLLKEIRDVADYSPALKCIIVVDDTQEDIRSKDRRYLSFEQAVERKGSETEPFRMRKEDIAILLYTSGTTGSPKGCAQTLIGVLALSHLMTRHVWDLGENDVLAGSAPISFAAGYGTFCIIPFASRGAISLLPKFSPEAFMSNIARHKVTVLTGIPTAYRKLLDLEDFENYDLGQVRLCTVGGDSLGKATFDSWKEKTGLPIWENYACTELFNAVISTRMGKQPKVGSIGRPLPGIETRIVGTHGRLCLPGETGSLWIKGPTGIIYWNPWSNGGRLLKAQKESIRDGWNIIGDAVCADKEGYLFFSGREDDMIKSSGYRVSPKEVEETLKGHPSIQDAAVIGVPHRVKGQLIKAFVILRGLESPEPEFEAEIKEYCKGKMAVYKTPHIIEYVSNLPRSPTGKVLKRDLLREEGVAS